MISRREFLKAIGVLTGGAIVTTHVELSAPEKRVSNEPTRIEATDTSLDLEFPNKYDRSIILDGQSLPVLGMTISVNTSIDRWYDSFVPLNKEWGATITTWAEEVDQFRWGYGGSPIDIQFVDDGYIIAQGQCVVKGAMIPIDGEGLRDLEIQGCESLYWTKGAI